MEQNWNNIWPRRSLVFKEYEENENDNYHAENILLLANNFGTEEDVETAKEILKQREK